MSRPRYSNRIIDFSLVLRGGVFSSRSFRFVQFVRPRARPLWMAAAELERAALIGWELSVVFVIVSSGTRDWRSSVSFVIPISTSLYQSRHRISSTSPRFTNARPSLLI